MPKQPRAVVENVLAFPPNRDTLGGTAYFIVEKDANILVDTPAWTLEHQQFLQEWGGVDTLILTQRDAIGRLHTLRALQEMFNCRIFVQEQEAYLLPQLPILTFEREMEIKPGITAIWTPGYSPGSSCVFYQAAGILFTGRHLLPNAQGQPMPLRSAKTFHWWRQLDSVAKLRDRFNEQTLMRICPGASTGYLRGQRAIENAYQQVAALDLEALRSQQALL